MVGESSNPWGNTVHWKRKLGCWLFGNTTEKANLSLSSSCRGIEKKQSLMSSTAQGRTFGIIEFMGNKVWTGPIGWIFLLTSCRSCRRWKPSPDHLGITNTGVFHRLVEGSMSFCCSSWLIISGRAVIRGFDKGHCLTHTGSFDFHASLMGSGGYTAVALRINVSL